MSGGTADLFAGRQALPRWDQALAPGAVILRGFALPRTPALRAALQRITLAAPFRHLVTPGGQKMSVAMTNCGRYGWFSDRKGYRYTSDDPDSGQPWPTMPPAMQTLAITAAAQAGFDAFMPDACLINRYQTGARLSLHQDKNEQDFDAPIVSVSLGVPAVFLFGGLRRADRPARVGLTHGDVVVWGGPARMRYHGVAPLRADYHDFADTMRINLTFRTAR